MCQITPFTLPCCQRVYVEVSRLPSCPDGWPKSKCPPELCIQVRGYEAEDRRAGTCWRCKAHVAGTAGGEREFLRPAIDRADVVIGLEDMGVLGRRKMTEDRGTCWFCGTKGVCEFCGTKTALPDNGVGKGVSRAPKRVGNFDTEQGSSSNKRVKIGNVESLEQAPLPAYPDPLNDTTWLGPYPQMYNDAAGNFSYPQQSHSTSNLGISGQEALSYRAIMPAYHHGNLQADQNAAITDQAKAKDLNFHSQQSLHPPDPGSGSGAEACFNYVGLHDQTNLGDFEDVNDAILSQALERYNDAPNNAFQVTQQVEQRQDTRLATNGCPEA